MIEANLLLAYSNSLRRSGVVDYYVAASTVIYRLVVILLCTDRAAALVSLSPITTTPQQPMSSTQHPHPAHLCPTWPAVPMLDDKSLWWVPAMRRSKWALTSPACLFMCQFWWINF
jgi:hypothetical protein